MIVACGHLLVTLDRSPVQLRYMAYMYDALRITCKRHRYSCTLEILSSHINHIQHNNKMYVTLHGVKNPRLLFLGQVSVALQEGLLSIFHWFSKPNSCRNIYMQRAGLLNFIFVQSHIFGHIPHDLLNPLVT